MNKIIIGSLLVASSLMAGDILAVVNGKKINTQDINILLKPNKIDYTKLAPQYKIQLLDKIIIDTLLVQKAKKAGLENTIEYKKGIEFLKNQYLVRLFLQKKLNSLKINDSEIKNFYYKFRDAMFKQPEQIKLKHILVKTKNEAEKIIQDLQNTSKSKRIEKFIELAKTNSLDPTKKVGGELGWVTKNSLIPEFANIVFNLNKNTFTKTPIKTKFGWHIAYIEDKKPAQYIPLNQVKDRIIQELKLQKLQKYIADLKSNSKIIYK